MKTKLILFTLMCCETHFSFAQLKVENLKIDTTITGFHYAANFGGLIVYTPNGKSPTSANPNLTLQPFVTIDIH